MTGLLPVWFSSWSIGFKPTEAPHAPFPAPWSGESSRSPLGGADCSAVFVTPSLARSAGGKPAEQRRGDTGYLVPQVFGSGSPPPKTKRPELRGLRSFPIKHAEIGLRPNAHSTAESTKPQETNAKQKARCGSVRDRRIRLHRKLRGMVRIINPRGEINEWVVLIEALKSESIVRERAEYPLIYHVGDINRAPDRSLRIGSSDVQFSKGRARCRGQLGPARDRRRGPRGCVQKQPEVRAGPVIVLMVETQIRRGHRSGDTTQIKLNQSNVLFPGLPINCEVSRV
jgi:hypothetical protein